METENVLVIESQVTQPVEIDDLLYMQLQLNSMLKIYSGESLIGTLFITTYHHSEDETTGLTGLISKFLDGNSEFNFVPQKPTENITNQEFNELRNFNPENIHHVHVLFQEPYKSKFLKILQLENWNKQTCKKITSNYFKTT